jgi:glycosyltransferase involved in cell wall biosynthesis
MAALEAQSVGTPVIASPYGGLLETVKGGILSYDFLNAVSQLRNKRRWEKLSVAGIEFARENTWSRVADKWLEEAKL